MPKQIRPLTAWKKAYPELYKHILKDNEASSAKGTENFIYWHNGLSGLSDFVKLTPPSFAFNSLGAKQNVGTVTELGRLFTTGWYYSLEEWALEVGSYVYKAYQRKLEKNEPFNDQDFTQAVKRIRENFGYYYSNPDQLKLFILETFFNEDLAPLLPPKPEILTSHDSAIDFLQSIHQERLKRNKKWYFENYNILEDYAGYLTEILDNAGIEYDSLSAYKASQKQRDNDYYQKIEEAKRSYRQSLGNDLVNSVNEIT